MLEIEETSALVAIVSLRAETKVVVLERDLDVCRAGFRVMDGMRSIFGAQKIAGLPALGAKDLLAESGFITGPFRVVRVGSQLPLAIEVSRLARGNQREHSHPICAHFLAAARPMIA